MTIQTTTPEVSGLDPSVQSRTEGGNPVVPGPVPQPQSLSAAVVVLSVVVILIFAFSIFPGAFATYLVITSGFLGWEVESWQAAFIDNVMPNLTSLPADILSAIAAALPASVVRACYRADDTNKLTTIGVLCLVLAVASATANILGFLLVRPDSEEFQQNIAPEIILQMLRSFSEKCGYFALVYSLMFLGLRPKS